MFDCVLVIQTIHLMIWCLRLTSPNKTKQKKKKKKKGKMKEKEKSVRLLAIYAVCVSADPGQ